MAEADFIPYRYAHIIFAEDLRAERSGQTTAVGWFRSQLLRINAPAPVVVPQLAVSAIIVSPKTEPISSCLLELKWRDTVLHEAVGDTKALDDLRASKDIDPETTRHAITMDLKQGQLVIDGDGQLTATVFADGKVLNRTALVFRFGAVGALD